MKLLPLPPLPFEAYQVHVCQSLTPFVVLTGWAWRQRSPRSAPNALQCYFLHDKINGLTQLRLITFVFHLLKKDVIADVLRCSQVCNETRMFGVLCGFPLSFNGFFFPITCFSRSSSHFVHNGISCVSYEALLHSICTEKWKPEIYNNIWRCSFLQASFTPFLTEHTYQALRPYIPETMKSGETESVHYLMLPKAR